MDNSFANETLLTIHLVSISNVNIELICLFLKRCSEYDIHVRAELVDDRILFIGAKK